MISTSGQRLLYCRFVNDKTVLHLGVTCHSYFSSIYVTFFLGTICFYPLSQGAFAWLNHNNLLRTATKAKISERLGDSTELEENVTLTEEEGTRRGLKSKKTCRIELALVINSKKALLQFNFLQ